MTDPKRRQFLQLTAALGSGVPLVGCGGGSGGVEPVVTVVTPDEPTAQASAVPRPLPSTPVPPPPPPPPAPAPAPVVTALPAVLYAGAMQFSLTSTASRVKAPFCVGFAFKQGAIPAGNTVASNLAAFQVTPRTTWPDGSLKFAQLAGFADITGGAYTTVRLSRTAATAAPAGLTLADLKKTGITAEVDAGALGKASFGSADWDVPLTAWASGPQMSSWVFRKPVGTDAHLTAWLEVRLYANGAVDVLPWIENGYLLVASPTNKSATYTFTLGGVQRFSGAIDLPHHCRTPLINGTALSYWFGATDPEVTPRHDVAYLQATELVPTYSARVEATSVAAQALATTYKPLAATNFSYDGDSMPATGYQEPIGLLPQHDVMYLTCSSNTTYGAVLRNGFAAGRYPIHYRDEKTQRPLRFSQYPNLVLDNNSSVQNTGSSTRYQFTPMPGGTAPRTWDCAHAPSVGYMAYLLTGWWYFMEEVQFAATLDYLSKGDNDVLRNGAQGLVQTCYGAWQTRACAWQWRTLVQALTVTPDSDTALRQELLSCVQTNIDHFHARYIAQPNNPFGWVLPGEGYTTEMQFGAPWQQDFVTAAFGYSLSLGLPVSSAHASRLDAFFRWKARSAIMRLGAATGFWYVNAAPYTVSITPVNLPDFTTGKGPWRADDAAVYQATYATKPTWFGTVEGKLAGEIMPGDRAAWGNLSTAMAYAVRHGVPGACTAYQRMVSASNYPALRDAFNNAPVWAIAPQRVLPAWLTGKPLNTWIEIPGTAGAGGSAVDAYSGMAILERNCEIVIAAAGGHNDSADNRVVSISLAADAPTWVVRAQPSKTPAQNVAYYADGLPTSRHLYSSSHVVPQLNRVMLFGARAAYGSAYDFAKVDAFNLDTNTWDAAGTWADAPSGHYGAVQIRASGEVVSSGLKKWSPADRTWTDLVTASSGDPTRWPMVYDSRRHQIFSLQWGDGQGFDPQRLVASRVPLAGTQQISVSFNSSSALTQWLADKPTYAGMDYDVDNDRILFYSGTDASAGRVYVIQPNDTNVWDMSLLTPAAGSATLVATGSGGLQNRLRYIPALRGFVLLARASSNLYFLRTA